MLWRVGSQHPLVADENRRDTNPQQLRRVGLQKTHAPGQPDILLAGFHFSHLGDDAGYDRLARHLPAHYLDADALPLGQYSFDTIAKPLNMVLLDMLTGVRMSRYRVIHYLHAENHLFFSSRLAAASIKVATVHLNKDFITNTSASCARRRLVKRLRKEAFQRLNGIIVLSSQDIAHYEQAFPQALVRFLPHGMHRLQPQPRLFVKKQPLRIAIVGANYRDQQLWCEVVREALQQGKPWTFELVGAPKEVKNTLGGLSNTIIHPYLTDAQYRELLTSCNALYLPLSFATANNALLEAHSVGLPAFVSNIPGAKDYALPGTRFCTGVAEALGSLAELEAMSVEQENLWRCQTFEGAAAFEWRHVAQQVLRYYDDVERHALGLKRGHGV